MKCHCDLDVTSLIGPLREIAGRVKRWLEDQTLAEWNDPVIADSRPFDASYDPTTDEIALDPYRVA
jgi:hypothetical protein